MVVGFTTRVRVMLFNATFSFIVVVRRIILMLLEQDLLLSSPDSKALVSFCPHLASVIHSSVNFPHSVLAISAYRH